MLGSDLSRWCYPKTILVLMRPSDDPAQVLWAMRQAEMAHGAKLLLAQLSAASRPVSAPDRGPQLVPRLRSADPLSASCTGHSLMWMEILRRAFVLHGITIDAVAGLVRTFSVDRVIATSSRGHGSAHPEPLEEFLISSLGIPVLILGRGMSITLQSPEAPRRILVPVFHPGDAPAAVKFASRLAGGPRASISVLHVIARSGEDSSGPGAVPASVDCSLPLSSAAVSPSDCSIEFAVREGDLATRILEFNAHMPHDLLVLPCPSLRTRSALSYASMIGHLSSHMPCPILALGESKEHAGRRTVQPARTQTQQAAWTQRLAVIGD